jgi:hypothetical protein
MSLRISYRNYCTDPGALASFSTGFPSDLSPLLDPTLTAKIVSTTVPTVSVGISLELQFSATNRPAQVIAVLAHNASPGKLLAALVNAAGDVVASELQGFIYPSGAGFANHWYFIAPAEVMANRVAIVCTGAEGGQALEIGHLWAGPLFDLPNAGLLGSRFDIRDKSQTEAARDGRHFARVGPRLRTHDLRVRGMSFPETFGGPGTTMDWQQLQMLLGTSRYALVLPRSTTKGLPDVNALHRLGIMAVAERWEPITGDGADIYGAGVLFRETG